MMTCQTLKWGVPVLALVALARSPATAADPVVVRGQVAATDPAANRLTVRTAAGKTETFVVAPGARLTAGGKPVTLADFKAGKPVRVTYREADGVNSVVALRPAVVTDADLKREVREALAATKQYTFRHKDEYAARVRDMLADVDDRIDRLEADAKDAGAEGRAKLEARISELKKRRQVLTDRLGKVRSATADAWGDLKDGFGTAARELEQWLDVER